MIDTERTIPPTFRMLIHPQDETRLLERLAGVLENAAVRFPDNFDKVKDRPNVVDHYGYRTSTRSLVVLSKESDVSQYYRLTIPLDEDHLIFTELSAIVTEFLGGSA